MCPLAGRVWASGDAAAFCKFLAHGMGSGYQGWNLEAFRKRTTSHIHSHSCHMLCDDEHQTQDTWTLKSEFWGIPQSGRWFQWQGCRVGGEAEHCLLRGGLGQDLAKWERLLGGEQSVGLWKPTWRKYILCSSSMIQSTRSQDTECAHHAQQHHRGAAGISCQFRSWHGTLKHQRFLSHPLVKPRDS